MRRFTNLVREGRFRAPAAADLRLGILVEVDPSDTDRVREADGTTGVAIGGSGDVRTDTCGILWYEHDSQTFNDPRFGGAAGQLPQDLDTAPRGRMVQVLRGRGAKVWFRNTGANETEPGLHYSNDRAAVTMVFGVGSVSSDLVVGDKLGWDATNNYWTATTTAAEQVLVVTRVNDALLEVDAELLI
jgi:hypothetical protein